MGKRDLFQHCLCGLVMGWHRKWFKPSGHYEWKIQRFVRGPRTFRCDQPPVCPLLYVAAGPWFSLGRKEGPCSRVRPNFQTNREFLLGTLAPWLARLLVRGGFKLCCDEEFEKAVAEIQHDTDHLRAVVARQWPVVSDFVRHFCTLRESKKHTDMRESHAQRAKKCDTNHIYVVKLPSGRGSRMKRWCKHFTPFQRIPVVCNVCILYISPSLLRVLLIFRRHLW